MDGQSSIQSPGAEESGPISQASPSQSTSDSRKRKVSPIIAVAVLWLVSLCENIGFHPVDKSTSSAQKIPTDYLLTQLNSEKDSWCIIGVSLALIAFELVVTCLVKCAGDAASGFWGQIRVAGQYLTPDAVLALETLLLGFFTIAKGTCEKAEIFNAMSILTGIFQAGFFPGTIFLLDKHLSQTFLNAIIAILILGIPTCFSAGKGVSTWMHTRSDNDFGALKCYTIIKGSIIIFIAVIFSLLVLWTKGCFPFSRATRSSTNNAPTNAESIKSSGKSEDAKISDYEVKCIGEKLWTAVIIIFRGATYLVATTNIYTIRRVCKNFTIEQLPEDWNVWYIVHPLFAVIPCIGIALWWRKKNHFPQACGAAAMALAAISLPLMSYVEWRREFKYAAMVVDTTGCLISLLTFCHLLLGDDRLRKFNARDYAIVFELGVGNLGCVVSDFMFTGEPSERLKDGLLISLIILNCVVAAGLGLISAFQANWPAGNCVLKLKKPSE